MHYLRPQQQRQEMIPPMHEKRMDTRSETIRKTTQPCKEEIERDQRSQTNIQQYPSNILSIISSDLHYYSSVSLENLQVRLMHPLPCVQYILRRSDENKKSFSFAFGNNSASSTKTSSTVPEVWRSKGLQRSPSNRRSGIFLPDHKSSFRISPEMAWMKRY